MNSLALLFLSTLVFANGRANEQVEVKFTIPPIQTQQLVDRLRLRSDQAEERRVYYYDTCNLQLFTSGIILRGRERAGTEDDLVLKLRPFESAWVDSSWQSAPGFGCEWDVWRELMVSSCTLSSNVRGEDLQDAEIGRRQIYYLFNESQILFARIQRSDFDIPWQNLTSIGPISSYAWKTSIDGWPHHITVEFWRLQSGTTITEVSVKVSNEELVRVREELFRLLQSWQLTPSEDATQKTRIALEETIPFEPACNSTGFWPER